MRWVVFVGLYGCNGLFGIHDTQGVDARAFDAPADAPFACPPIGVAPRFSSLVHQVFVENCQEYSFNAGRAAALCEDNGFPEIAEGVIDQVLPPARGVPLSAGNDAYDQPRLSSDGQFMLVRHINYLSNALDVMMFQRMADNSWQLGPAPPFGTGTNDSIGTIAHGPTGERVLVRNFDDNSVHEWAFEGTTWREVLVHPGSMLGVPVGEINITADGLRAVVDVLGLGPAAYTDRPDENTQFRPAVLFEGGPRHTSPVMTEDCARLYVTGLGAVFYVQQL